RRHVRLRSVAVLVLGGTDAREPCVRLQDAVHPPCRAQCAVVRARDRAPSCAAGAEGRIAVRLPLRGLRLAHAVDTDARVRPADSVYPAVAWVRDIALSGAPESAPRGAYMSVDDILIAVQSSPVAHAVSKSDHLVGATLQILHVLG